MITPLKETDLINLTSTQRIPRVIFYFLFLLPLLFHYWLLYRYAVDVPFMDDFGAILDFMNHFIVAGFPDKLDLLFSQHLEHRIVFSRLFFLFDYYLFGELNMKTIILLGNTGLIFTSWSIYKLLPEDKNKNLLFLPIPYFLIQSQHYESAYWAMACMQNLYVAGFAVLALINLAGETMRSFWFALAFAALALLTSGNGIFLFPCGVLLLLLKRQWNYKLAGWTIFSAVLLGLYFRHYVQTEFDLTLQAKLSQFPDRLLGSLLGGIGSAFNFEKHHDTFDKGFGFLVAISMGIFFLLLFFEQIRNGNALKRPVLFTVQIFFVLSIAAACVSRFQFGEDYTSVASRYKINSLMIFVALYLVFVPGVRREYLRQVLVGLTILTVVYNVASFWNNRSVIKSHRNALLRTSWVLYEKNSYDAVVHFDPPSVVPILEESKRIGAYTIPDLSDYYDNVAKSTPVEEEVPVEQTVNISAAVEILTDPVGGYYTIEHGWAFRPGKNSTGNKIYIILKAATKAIVFQTEAQKRGDVTAEFGSTNDGDFNYDDSGFGFFINRTDIEPLKYQVGVMIVGADDTRSYLLTESWIDNTEKMDSKKATLELPAVETKDIQFGFNVIASKEWFEIENGWAVVEGLSSAGNRIYVVLKSEADTLIFETGPQTRQDVTAYFRNREADVSRREGMNYDDSGFNFVASVRKLGKDVFSVGLIIVDAKGTTHYILSERTVNNTGGKVLKSAIPLSRLSDFQLPAAGDEIENAFELVDYANNLIVETGWAFIKNWSTDNQVTYFVLSGEDRSYVFETQPMLRPDVTAYFAKTHPGINLDKSGFGFNAKTKELEPGTYVIGIAIRNGDKTAFSKTDKVYDVK